MHKLLNPLAVILCFAAVASAQTGADNTRRQRATEKRVSRREQSDAAHDARVLQLAPTVTYLKVGLSLFEVVRGVGQPLAVADRQDDARRVTYTFRGGRGRVLLAEFVDGRLVRAETVARANFAREVQAGQ